MTEKPSAQSGGANTAVGATRVVKIGEQQVFEKLVALDDEEHVLCEPTMLVFHPRWWGVWVAASLSRKRAGQVAPSGLR